MAYSVKELFFTLQGEGAQTGRSAVFCRFTGCNLWNGREADRTAATCNFCDTDFVGTDGPGGGRFGTPDELADRLLATWRRSASDTDSAPPFVVFTGGEPTLQVDELLVAACHARGMQLAIETNGTRHVPPRLDWVCVSPKASELAQRSGQELKLVFPQAGLEPERFADLEFDHFFLQPMDGPSVAENTAAAIAYCQRHPSWRLSLQTHKLLGIP